MKKLSEYKDGEAVELLADILEPVTKIMTAKPITEMFNGKASKMELAKTLLKECKDEVVAILYVLDDSPPNDGYNVFSILKNLLEILNDKDLIDFFASQVQTDSSENSGSVMENTEETETK